jgi:sugar phosphate isomerase/epimerase
MTTDLMLHMLGLRAELSETIELAQRNGFESIGPDAAALLPLSTAQLHDLRATLAARGLVWGATRLLLDFRGDEEIFHAGMRELPKFAMSLQHAGVTRVGTALRPRHDTLTYLANFRQHTRRLRDISSVLGDHGQRLGLEYIAARTAWSTGRHAFIHTLAETRELIASIDRPNVGVVLDSWHWYHAEESDADLLALTNADVVACEVNDAPRGLPRDQMSDTSRELPGVTGVIDVKTFLSALVKIGYDGPVRVEPFNAAFRALPLAEAVAVAAQTLRRAVALIG